MSEDDCYCDCCKEWRSALGARRSEPPRREAEMTRCGVHGCGYIGACPECHRIACAIVDERRGRREAEQRVIEAALQELRAAKCSCWRSDIDKNNYSTCGRCRAVAILKAAAAPAETAPPAQEQSAGWTEPWGARVTHAAPPAPQEKPWTCGGCGKLLSEVGLAHCALCEPPPAPSRGAEKEERP